MIKVKNDEVKCTKNEKIGSWSRNVQINHNKRVERHIERLEEDMRSRTCVSLHTQRATSLP